MIIAQNSVSIDENAQMAEQAVQHADNLNKTINSKLETLQSLGSQITQSTHAPTDPGADPNEGHHNNGDMWIQLSDDRQTALAMYNYSSGNWLKQNWATASLNVSSVTGLTIHGGIIDGGTINGAQMNSGEINVNISGSTGASDEGVHHINWDASGFNKDDISSPGFHFSSGLMNFKAQRQGNSYDAPGQWDFTFLGPNDLKVRGSRTPDTQAQHINNRSDIRGDYIVTTAWGYARPQPAYWNSQTKQNYGENHGCILNADGTAIISNHLKCRLISAGASGRRVHFMSGLKVDDDVHANNFIQKSDASTKYNIKGFNTKNALSEVLGTSLYSYRYKDSPDTLHLGPVIDDINKINEQKYNTSEYIIDRENGNDSVSLMNLSGLLVGAVQELSKQNEQLLGKITRLERLNNGNH